jgi:heat shock protein HtpX
VQRVPLPGNPATAHLFIMEPLAARAGRGRGMLALFSTHPPTEQRIERLMKIR